MKRLFFLLCLLASLGVNAQMNVPGPDASRESEAVSVEVQRSINEATSCTEGMTTTYVSLVSQNNWTDEVGPCVGYGIQYYYFELDPAYSQGTVTITQLPGTGNLRLEGSDAGPSYFFSGVLHVQTFGGPFGQGGSAQISVIYDGI